MRRVFVSHCLGLAVAFMVLVMGCHLNVIGSMPGASRRVANTSSMHNVGLPMHEHHFAANDTVAEQRQHQEPVHELGTAGAGGRGPPLLEVDRNPPTADVSGRPYFVEWPGEYYFVVDEPRQCRRHKPFAVIIVPVAPGDRASRDTIRSLWGADTQFPVLGKRVSLFFLLGLPTGEGAGRIQDEVLQESRHHHDLLQGSFQDTYRNLTIKSMVMMEWLQSRCPTASYYMKVDTDMMVNVHSLVDMLLDAPRENYVTGLVPRAGEVIRDKDSKWFLPHEVYPDSHYPAYARGPAYVFSSDMPRKLLAASLHVDALFLEDVYIGLCMKHLGIPFTDLPYARRNMLYVCTECSRYV